jgi:predicted nucleic acid-binding protein
VTIVVDASVALKWVFEETGSEEALALRTERLIAPALWLAEAGNALWRRVHAGTLMIEEAAEQFFELRQAPVVSASIEPHIAKALELAITIGHPIYDCLYLALAIYHNTYVGTADRRFATAADRSEIPGRVRLLGS